MDFITFFRTATRDERCPTGRIPFPYQEEFATADEPFDLLQAPTGAGKTATVVIGWLWRYFRSGKATPRRLAYCLPMRVLVEQTRDEARKWLSNLHDAGLIGEVGLHVLMGGEDAGEWDLHLECPTILIGTQDMLLSRALNRGYGMGRFRWPMHFGLLNNDCQWVLDEIQLMSTGLATSTQLQAFRENLGTIGEARTLWMSATLRPDWLASIDFRERIGTLKTQNLTEKDYQADGLRERWAAVKPLTRVQATADDAAGVARFVRETHQPGTLTLVVVNTVKRSRDLYAALRTADKPRTRARRGAKQPKEPDSTATPGPDIRLIHSRFRPIEREEWMTWLKATPPPEGRIVISTQVVEAGVDLSARTLVTELAPWPSLVQRFGRCNRYGEFTDARVFWVDVPTDKKGSAAPYSEDELKEARTRLTEMADVGLQSLQLYLDSLTEKQQQKLFPYSPSHVVRRKDFVDLFDTTPDLAGNDIDVSRFIREGDDFDVQVFWRTEVPPRREVEPAAARRLAPVRRELCPAPVNEFRDFVKEHRAFLWDALDGRWVTVNESAVIPGRVFWVTTDEGGYSKESGWNPKTKWDTNLELHTPPEKAQGAVQEPHYDGDLLSQYGWRSIAEHTGDVIEEVEEIAGALNLNDRVRAILRAAARWHDWGKAHPVFQGAIKDEPDGEGKRPKERAGKLDIAKASPEKFWKRYTRKHFRHELASALGVLSLFRRGITPQGWEALSADEQNIALYLIASHHGKVRLSIRSMPDERKPAEPNRLFARGVHDGDELPGMDLGTGVKPASVKLDLSPMLLGRSDGHPSWAERMLGLRDHKDLGPSRLAFLEAVLRAADGRASKKADEKARTKHE